MRWTKNYGFSDGLDLIPISLSSVISGEQQKNTTCYRGQKYCDALFYVEKRLKDLSPEERYHKRLIELKPVMDAFFEWLKVGFPQTVPDSPAYKQFSMP